MIFADREQTARRVEETSGKPITEGDLVERITAAQLRAETVHVDFLLNDQVPGFSMRGSMRVGGSGAAMDVAVSGATADDPGTNMRTILVDGVGYVNVDEEPGGKFSVHDIADHNDEVAEAIREM